MVSKDYIILDGVSSNTIGVYCDTPSVPPMARQRYTVFQTGAEEDGTTPDNTYEDISYTVTLYGFFDEDFHNEQLYAYLYGKSRLEFSRHTGFYYKIRRLEVEAPEATADGNAITYRVTFTLSPFRYYTENSAISVNSGDLVSNAGTYFCRPVITVTGSGNITITVNGREFNLYDVSGTVTIDSERHICYSGNTVIYNKDSGSYPLLAVGENLIEYTGNVTAVSLVKNERCF